MRSEASARQEKTRLMPIIVVARLRLRDPSLLDEFFTHAAAVLEQAQKTDGNLGADAFADTHNVWWDVTAWQSRAPIEVS
jgi:quinol monooxygenase YgiN